MRTPNSIIISVAVLAILLVTGCSKSSSEQPSRALPSDASDPYPGDGGLFQGTPDRKDVDSGRINFAPEKFASLKIGSTTKVQVAALLGKPAGWLTETNGTSQLEYDYVEPGGASDLRKVIYVYFTFDAKRVLTRLEYPDYDSDKRK
jgi:outer membrane protein assembly factor BamE (lipoprotein component of BamABCDE complex)